MSLRNNLIKLRKEKGYTQESIAKELGITPRQYQYLEAGTSYGSVSVWENLRDILGAENIDILLVQNIDQKGY